MGKRTALLNICSKKESEMDYDVFVPDSGLTKKIFFKRKNNIGVKLIFLSFLSMLIGFLTGCNNVKEKTYNEKSVPIVLNAKQLTIKYAPDISTPIIHKSTKLFLFHLENWAHKRFYPVGQSGHIEIFVTKAFLKRNENNKESFKPVLTGVLNVSIREIRSQCISHIADFKIEQDLESVFIPTKNERAILEKRLILKMIETLEDEILSSSFSQIYQIRKLKK